MRLHRFYVGDEVKLQQAFWLHDTKLLYQWRKVLRLSAGAEVVLFDGASHDRLYKISSLDTNEAHLQHVTDLVRKVPKKEIYLFWSLLKKDKNDWVLQKCTEIGVSHFVPLLANRSEKTGFDRERAAKIIIEASEQCGRSDIPSVREPMLVETAIKDYVEKIPLFVCEQSEGEVNQKPQTLGVFVGPEGGWAENELQMFGDNNITRIGLGEFTLRAETAAVVASSKVSA